MPFGLYPAASCGCGELQLRPGDRIVLVTDGMLERNAEDLDLPGHAAARGGHPPARAGLRARGDRAARHRRRAATTTPRCCAWTGAAAPMNRTARTARSDMIATTTRPAPAPSRRWWSPGPPPRPSGRGAGGAPAARDIVEAGWVQNRWTVPAQHPPRRGGRAPTATATDGSVRACVVAAVALAVRARDPRADLAVQTGPALAYVWDEVFRARRRPLGPPPRPRGSHARAGPVERRARADPGRRRRGAGPRRRPGWSPRWCSPPCLSPYCADGDRRRAPRARTGPAGSAGARDLGPPHVPGAATRSSRGVYEGGDGAIATVKASPRSRTVLVSAGSGDVRSRLARRPVRLDDDPAGPRRPRRAARAGGRGLAPHGAEAGSGDVR